MQEHKGLHPNPLVSGPATTILASSAFTTSGSGAALIQPPKRTSRVVRVELNSVDRDYTFNPSASEFRWRFPFPVKEVREVRLVGGTVPVPFLNIDTEWNRFVFMDNQTNYTLSIPPGFYTIATLAAALQTALNDFGGFNTYAVSQKPASGELVITATGGADFGFLFGSGDYHDELDPQTRAVLMIRSPAHILGFGTADYYGVGGVLTAPRLPNLWYPLERTYLYLNFDSSIDLRGIFRGAGRREPSVILYNDELNIYNQPNQQYGSAPIPLTKYLNKETYDSSIMPSPAALSRISYLEVSLRDMFYRPINTQGREMTLLLDLVIVD